MLSKEIVRKAPAIKTSYAPEKVRYGAVLRIYIEAEALDGDMLKIASVVDQVGYGRYATDWIYLGPQYQHHFRGYLQWNTFSSSTSYISEWTQVTLKVSVFDKAGNESNVVVFPFQFVSEAIPESQPPPSFYEGDPRLGYLNINLLEPSLMGG
jgi:hypothetical protein